jgi:hypothetical protein
MTGISSPDGADSDQEAAAPLGIVRIVIDESDLSDQDLESFPVDILTGGSLDVEDDSADVLDHVLQFDTSSRCLREVVVSSYVSEDDMWSAPLTPPCPGARRTVQVIVL